MQKSLLPVSVLAIFLLTGGVARAVTNFPARGLWVGEVTLQKVNETVDGINAANQRVSPDPAVPTPVNSPAHMRIIFHVDNGGQVRLLKGVAILNKSTNDTPNIAIVSDPSLYSQFGDNLGQRITAVAYDFGDANASAALNKIINDTASAAVNGGNPTAAASLAVQYAKTNVPVTATEAYTNFIGSATFSNSATMVTTSIAASLAGSGSLSQARKLQIAQAAAINALTDANVFAAADAIVPNEVLMTGSFAASGTLTGNIYLGADHPTNPFRHKWSPDHRHGYAITRALTVNFDSASSSNAVSVAGFGVDRITGNYREEITGLHKPLGQNQNVGLITEGFVTLERVSQVDTLNH